uniref:CCT domain-containing protein n=1 Tax=Aegilops tauschii subsp. strangulata TaxID=200361 RepID=A0A453NBH7_AEGTS
DVLLHTHGAAAGPGHGEGGGVAGGARALVAAAAGALLAVLHALGGLQRVLLGHLRVAQARAGAAEAPQPGLQRGRRAARLHPPLRLPRQEEPQDGHGAAPAALGPRRGLRRRRTVLLRPPPAAPRPVRRRSPSTDACKNCSSPTPVSSAFREFRDPAPSPASPDTATDEPGELDFDDDGFDAESILDVDEAAAGGAAEGIDGIMGSLTMEANTATATSDDSILSSSGIHPYLRSLMVVGLAGRFELGLGSRQNTRPNLNRALKRRDDDGAWWMWPAVPVKDITVTPPTPPPTEPAAAVSNTAMPPPASAAPEKKKSKKKKKVKMEKLMAKEEESANGKCEEGADGTVDAADGNGDGDSAPTKAPKTGLGLKLDTDDVLKEWSGKGSMFAEGSGPDSSESAAEVRAKLADIDLFPENGSGGIREARVMRYKEKRRNRLFSKKIRYQVRKVNADCRPRMKGRFVRSPSLLQQALEEES